MTDDCEEVIDRECGDERPRQRSYPIHPARRLQAGWRKYADEEMVAVVVSVLHAPGVPSIANDKPPGTDCAYPGELEDIFGAKDGRSRKISSLNRDGSGLAFGCSTSGPVTANRSSFEPNVGAVSGWSILRLGLLLNIDHVQRVGTYQRYGRFKASSRPH